MRRAPKSFLTIVIISSIAACTDPGPETGGTNVASPAWGQSSRTGSFEGSARTELCALDAVNGLGAVDGAFAVRRGESIALEGWASTSTLRTPPTIRIVLDNSGDNASDTQLSGPTGIARDDVAKAYNTQALANAGFKAELAALSASAGEYAIVVEHDESGTPVVCRTNLRLIVR